MFMTLAVRRIFLKHTIMQMLMEKNNRFDNALILKLLYNFKKVKDKANEFGNYIYKI